MYGVVTTMLRGGAPAAGRPGSIHTGGATFYGRSHIPGIVCSARVRFKGSVGIRADGHPVMINPAYELLFPAV